MSCALIILLFGVEQLLFLIKFKPYFIALYIWHFFQRADELPLYKQTDTGWPLFWKTWKSQGIEKRSGKSQGK